jgi:hypothetical protein
MERNKESFDYLTFTSLREPWMKVQGKAKYDQITYICNSKKYFELICPLYLTSFLPYAYWKSDPYMLHTRLFWLFLPLICLRLQSYNPIPSCEMFWLEISFYEIALKRNFEYKKNSI